MAVNWSDTLDNVFLSEIPDEFIIPSKVQTDGKENFRDPINSNNNKDSNAGSENLSEKYDISLDDSAFLNELCSSFQRNNVAQDSSSQNSDIFENSQDLSLQNLNDDDSFKTSLKETGCNRTSDVYESLIQKQHVRINTQSSSSFQEAITTDRDLGKRNGDILDISPEISLQEAYNNRTSLNTSSGNATNRAPAPILENSQNDFINDEIVEYPEYTQDSSSQVRPEIILSNSQNYDSKCCQLSFWGLPENILKKYEEKKISKMFPWQVECLNNDKVMSGERNLIYSAPTSAGKTLVAEILALKTLLERKKKVLVILPFVSVVREKMFYFQSLLQSTKIRVDGFMGSYNPPGGFEAVNLAICTIEKANSLVNRLLQENKIDSIGAIIVDEIHLIGDHSRGYLLELLLTKVRYLAQRSVKNVSVNNIQVIGMSATLPNLNLLAEWLDAHFYVTDFRPIPLNEYIYISGEIYNTELKLVKQLEPLPDLGVDVDNILQLCLETIKESASVLIFCPTKNWCESLSQQIAAAFFKLGSLGSTTLGQLIRTQLNSGIISEVLEQLKLCPVGLDEILRKTISFGVAFHHAGLTMDERDIVEAAFRNGAVRVLVATSTLSSGVNLPARRVIIRTPNFHGKPIDPLVYRQMIGRAGRMGKDSLGESILICQNNDRNTVKNLLKSTLEPIESCLDDADKIVRAILEVIVSGIVSSSEDVKQFSQCTLLAASSKEDENLCEPIFKALDYLVSNEFICLQDLGNQESQYTFTSLGKACLSSSINPREAISLFVELDKARRCLCLDSELHLIYLVTPYSACYQWGNIDWMLYLDLWSKLPKSMKRVGEMIGIEESYIIRATRSQISTNSTKLFNKMMIHKRFFIALALQDIVNELPFMSTATKFNCNRGTLQSLQQSASTFAGMVTSFSKQLRWSSIEILISQFQDRLHHGVSRDLLDLMKLPVLTGARARALYNNGIETLAHLANSDISTVESVLIKLMPFESKREKEGESEFEYRERNKWRNIWVTGKEGITEREAAEMLISDARKYLEIELGLEGANWNTEDDKNSKDSCLEETSSSIDLFNNDQSINVSPKVTDSNKSLLNNNNNTSDGSLFSPNSCNLNANIDGSCDSLENLHLELKDSASDQSLFDESFKSHNNSSPSEDNKFIINRRVLKETNQMLKKRTFDDCEPLDITVTPKKKGKFNIDPEITAVPYKTINISCQNFESFSKELLQQTNIALSIGCVKSPQNEFVIGENIIGKKPPKCERFDDNLIVDERLITGISFTWENEKNIVYYTSFENIEKSLLSKSVYILKKLVSRNISVTFFDSKEQVKLLKKCFDVDFKTRIEDPKIGEWLLNPDQKEKSLHSLTRKYCPGVSNFLDSIGSVSCGSIALDYMSSIDSKVRSSAEAFIMCRLMKSLKVEMNKENPKLSEVFGSEMKCVSCLAKIEMNGFPVKKSYIENIILTLRKYCQNLEKKVYQLAGRTFSLSSSKDVATVLGLYKGKKVSVKKDVLKKSDNPIAECILEWRRINFMLTQQIYPLVHQIIDDTLYGSYITHSLTGRISMHEPNLQNVSKDFPIQDPLALKTIKISCRSAFTSLDDCVLLSADYCQLELRLLAHFSQDKVLCQIMRSQEDIFKSVAAKWNKISENEVDDSMRQHAKQICYGVIYGMGTKSLSQQLKVGEEEAEDFMERFHSCYPGIKKYITKIVDECLARGYIETISGRRRYLPNINNKGIGTRKRAERQAINTSIQGSAADIAKKAMVSVDRELDSKFKNLPLKPAIVLHLHDELIFNVPKEQLKNVAMTVKRVMEGAVNLSIPFPVKLKSGPSWGQLTELKL